MFALRDEEFRILSGIAFSEAGLHFEADKKMRFACRVQRRIQASGLGTVVDYIGLLQAGSPAAERERRQFVSAVTTNVTGVFREPHHFAVTAAFLKRRLRSRPSRRVRLWSAGCSTGEEALSLAATCRAALGEDWASRVEIVATDVDVNALSVAEGRRDDRVLREALDAGARRAVEDDAVPQIGTLRELTRRIRYGHRNLFDGWPADASFDVVMCRNVMIYFSRDMQRLAQRELLRCLPPGGLLCIGHSERLLVGRGMMSMVAPTSYIRKRPTATGVIDVGS